jgi:hypothetical protein
MQLSPDKEEQLAKAEQYLSNHEGMRMVSRMKTEEYFE